MGRTEPKFYKVEEEDLKSMLAAEIELAILEADGVDNWWWYMESRSRLMEKYYGDKDLSCEEAAELELERYERIFY
jgi:hypothetical protein